jgi:hypothetical protein
LVVGLLIGAGGIIGIGALVGASNSPTTTVPSEAVETTTTAARPVWFDAAETVVGPAVLFPEGLSRDGNEVVFRYDLATLAPLADVEPTWQWVSPQIGIAPVDPAELEPVYPVRWSLVTAGGDIAGETSNPSARAARFDVAEGFDLASIEGIRIDEYRIPVPIDVEFELSEGSPRVEVAPGVSVSLISMVDQGEQTIVQVEIESDEGLNRQSLSIGGVGPQWRSAVREAEGRPRYNLRLGGPERSGPVLLRAWGFVWLPAAEVVLVNAGGSE